MSGLEALLTAGELASAWRSQYRDLAWHRAAQRRRLAAILERAHRDVPAYADRPLDPRLDPFEQLGAWPLLTRREIQEDPERHLAVGASREGWRSSRTSGSTGAPLTAHFDPRSWRRSKVVYKLRRSMAVGWRPFDRLMIVEALPPDALAKHARDATLSGERWLGGRDYLSLFEPPAQQLDAYAHFAPHFVYAPPSYLHALAEVWTADVAARVPLKGLMTSAEWASPAARTRLEDNFGVPVRDVYGSTEFKEVAWQCGEGAAYHVNMENVLVEILDESGRPCVEGTPGEVVLTTLSNTAMPLIRYATGDAATRLAAKCACGRGLEQLARIEGRKVDTIRLPGDRIVSPYALTSAVELHAGVAQYRIVQRDADALFVEVVLRRAEPVDRASILEAIRRDVAAVVAGGATPMRVDVQQVDAIARGPSGKHRPVEVVAPEVVP